jgi:polyisoprenoid-binding protein YceI
VQCAKDDEDLGPAPVVPGPAETGAVNSFDGTYSFDKVHSNVNWETYYYAEGARLTGKFNNFNLKVDFNSADPASSRIEGWVQLSTFNTGEAGRDGAGKCGPGYVGVEYLDTNFTVDPTTDSAWFSATGSVVEADHYVTKGNFTFNGVTKQVEFKYFFLGINQTTNSTGDVTNRAGFRGQFRFMAQSDYGVTSTSIGDEMIVTVNANFKD